MCAQCFISSRSGGIVLSAGQDQQNELQENHVGALAGALLLLSCCGPNMHISSIQIQELHISLLSQNDIIIIVSSKDYANESDLSILALQIFHALQILRPISLFQCIESVEQSRKDGVSSYDAISSARIEREESLQEITIKANQRLDLFRREYIEPLLSQQQNYEQLWFGDVLKLLQIQNNKKFESDFTQFNILSPPSVPIMTPSSVRRGKIERESVFMLFSPLKLREIQE
ncbi:MAG: hypothetical protein EZS28_004777 [Streblomastix strix]|uniref:Uncharacterized protein n=1 Tax=Streblomastix strix TaxID=222440 RepID=A0A5J4WY08_9EUKA|nr:MAG: hypothetical protein EZS28_004777 [Streblomastix strix]